MGLSYRKGQGLKENMVSADEMMDSYKKQRSGYGVSTGLLASAIIQGMTKDLSSLDDLKNQKSVFEEFFNRNNNYPYSEEAQIKANEMLRLSWKDFVDKARELNIGSEGSSMNESLRAARQNAQQDKDNSKTEKVK